MLVAPATSGRAGGVVEFQNGDVVGAGFQEMTGKEQRASAAAIPEAAKVVAVDPNDAEREIPHVEERARQVSSALPRRGHVEGSVIERRAGVRRLRRLNCLNVGQRQRKNLPIGQFDAIEECAADQSFAGALLGIGARDNADAAQVVDENIERDRARFIQRDFVGVRAQANERFADRCAVDHRDGVIAGIAQFEVPLMPLGKVLR